MFVYALQVLFGDVLRENPFGFSFCQRTVQNEPQDQIELGDVVQLVLGKGFFSQLDNLVFYLFLSVQFCIPLQQIGRQLGQFAPFRFLQFDMAEQPVAGEFLNNICQARVAVLKAPVGGLF